MLVIDSEMISPWFGRSVFVTGHTGFKGSWLCVWLEMLGAKVHGYALDPLSESSIFDVAGIGRVMASDVRADVQDIDALTRAVRNVAPEVVFHLAAQPLVRESYRDPLHTWSTNVLGTANLLHAVRAAGSVRSVVVVTTDKVYSQRGGRVPFREDDPLGGDDPYSASKAATELVAASYRTAFLRESEIRVATARAGNVVGGGDCAIDRLVPDCLRALAGSLTLTLRNPKAIRPWQHVLEPLAGYLTLAQRLLESGGEKYARAWNFGPGPESHANVESVAKRLTELWGAHGRIEFSDEKHPHEAEFLALDSGDAQRLLGWTPRLTLDDALRLTVQWQQQRQRGRDMILACREQIREYGIST